MSRQINLAIIEENPVEIPEEIQRMGREALQILWQVSKQIAQQEIESIKKQSQQRESELTQQYQESLDKVERMSHELTTASANIDSLTRENKSLQVDINRKLGELKSAADQIAFFQEKLVQQEHEIKQLSEESGRVRENAENLKKRLYEVTRQTEQDQVVLKEISEESAVNIHIRERLEKNLKTAMQESEEVWKQLKREQSKAATAEALVQEMKEATKKYEVEIKLLKQEKQELKDAVEAEVKTRIDLEKRLATVSARLESQEWGYKEMIAKLEKELEIVKAEASQVRNRMIKAEGALEREKKAIERLETKIIAATGTKL
jgi:chromosome segregation ATPase